MFFLYLLECMCEFGINLGVGGTTEPMVTTGEPSNGIDLLVGFFGWLFVILIICGIIFFIKSLNKKRKETKKKANTDKDEG